ncbi:methionyl-tRNA formyltransferase [Corynebacterium sp. 153RC1]|uniref:methionyl-tRNA formyltransferase n=1 Tax=unclassified Corynebacterium TaxID=2624378 RepID=UPI00211C2D9F|nr:MULTISPECIES: methionyl-tRNA formyltransferase [unclassified Corynebacterium]MCQ9351447.1 methionyl-tRNA formyltransferase [Corynebacterium sp. 209RC1]MCQ9354576.1 methionyl-tRNA formyltransferase [Corynebacterium sp. 1222RC1]MCQ9357367.1 methionyl-tRNA formyltransferase [Corynebacterium sp. 122RC1]MCQ9357974.1 methionyl-tRNA formyltransferase [Corynebacterium sp. 142RC1]MCQ9360422.1 methionyl-tRNA formyltransferase [Corynebacterium sp. 153RC1]
MRLLFAGTPEPAVVALQALLRSEHEVAAVLTRPDAPKGRGRKLVESPVAALAREHGIATLKPATIKPGTPDGEQFRVALADIAPDCIPVVAYGNLVTPDLLEAVPHGWVNLHFSLLPSWRGAAPVQAAIRAGDSLTGATTFRIDEGLDTGPILATLQEEIQPLDTADDLLTRLAFSGAELLVRTMDGLENGSLTPQPQPAEGTYAPKILPADAHVDFSAPAEEIDRLIRSVTPAPGAWAMLGEARFKLGPVLLLEEATLEAGAMRIEKQQVVVGTGSYDVRLTTLQPQGKKMMDAAAWGRGVGHVEERFA